MSFTIAGAPLTEWAKLTANTVTDLLVATKPTIIVFMAITETGATTQTLLLRRLAADGTTTHVFRPATNYTASAHTTFDEIFRLNVGDKLQGQSSDAAGKFDINITYLVSDAQNRG